jgi:type I restriction enzyme M protein
MTTSALVQKLWNYCNVLRDDGMSYGDYVEQLTYLLFLKMADERSRPPYSQPSLVPAQYAWPALLARDGDALFDHYRHAFEALAGRIPRSRRPHHQGPKSCPQPLPRHCDYDVLQRP